MASKFDSFKFAAALERHLEAFEKSQSAKAREPIKLSFDDFKTQAEAMENADAAFEQSAGSAFELDEAIEQHLNTMTDLAAISGLFDPHQVVNQLQDDKIKQEILKRLLKFCLIDTESGRALWLLNKETRVQRITSLIDSDLLERKLSEALPETDEVGRKMRELLRGTDQTKFSEISQNELIQYALAVEYLEGLDFHLPVLTDLRAQIDRNNFLEEQGFLEERFFVGRDYELKKLFDFINRKRNWPKSWEGLILSGIGGAGKSALLNKFTRTLFHKKTATIVTLDFDRPGIDTYDVKLETELLKQVALQYAIGDKELDETLRNVSSLNVRERGGRKRRGVYPMTIVFGILKDKLSQIGKTDTPFLLVLDTFEEALQGGSSRTLLYWIDQIAELLKPTPVYVIFSGRLFEDTEDYPNSPSIKQTIHIGEFDNKLAESFLSRQNVPARTAKQLARSDWFPKRPLELKLLAKLFMQEGATGLDQLKNDLSISGNINKDIFAGIVYRRVLVRLQDPLLQKLAYPGLILRYLTTEIIRGVLTPLIGLTPMNESEAERLLDALASHGWLAYRMKKQLWHRKDLRRAILRVMIANEPSWAEEIHRTAISYFSTLASSKAEQMEAFYHFMMLDCEEFLDSPYTDVKLDDILEYLQGDTVDFPLKSKKLLDFYWHRKVSHTDLDLLPEKVQPMAYEELGNQFIERREYLKAKSLFKIKVKYDKWLAGELELTRNWEFETIICTASWGKFNNNLILLEHGELSINVNTLFLSLMDERVDRSLLSQAVFEYIKSPAFLNDLEREKNDLTPIVSRLVYCLMVISANNPFAPYLHIHLNVFLKTLRKLTYNKLNDELYRSILLLELCAGNRYFPNHLMVPTFAKLDINWLEERLSRSSSLRVLENLSPINNILRSYDNKKKSTSQNVANKKLLGEIDSARYSNEKAPDFRYPAIDSGLMFDEICGPFPDLRLPCKYAIIDAFIVGDDIDGLGELLSEFTPFNIENPIPSRSPALRRNPEEELDPVMELLDRTWQIGNFIEKALMVHPANVKLKQVYKFHNTWYSSYQTVWERSKLTFRGY